MEITVVDHPIARERLTRLRDKATGPAEFRRTLHELAGFLVYEATRELEATTVEVATPLAPAPGVRIDRPPIIVPILRAGLGMLPAALDLLPGAPVGFVGLRRNEATFEPDPYVTTVPEDLGGRPVIVLDPMLATGGSLSHTCTLLREKNAGPITTICTLAAPEGLERIDKDGHDITVVTVAIDDHLSDTAFIVPGLGDAGDRQFGAG